MSKERDKIEDCYKWDLKPLYPSTDAWEKDFKSLNLSLPQVDLQRNLKETLKKYFDINRLLTKLYTYAHLKHDEDVSHEVYKTMFNKIMAKHHEFAQMTSWLEPALLKLDNPKCPPYQIYLDKVMRMKPHTLSEREEE